MKKLFAIILSCILLLSFPVSVFAAETKKELNLDNYTIFVKDRVLEKKGITKNTNSQILLNESGSPYAVQYVLYENDEPVFYSIVPMAIVNDELVNVFEYTKNFLEENSSGTRSGMHLDHNFLVPDNYGIHSWMDFELKVIFDFKVVYAATLVRPKSIAFRLPTSNQYSFQDVTVLHTLYADLYKYDPATGTLGDLVSNSYVYSSSLYSAYPSLGTWYTRTNALLESRILRYMDGRTWKIEVEVYCSQNNYSTPYYWAYFPYGWLDPSSGYV